MRSTDSVPRTVPAGVKNGTKLLRLKISSKQGQLQAGHLQTDAAPNLDPAVGSSNSSSNSQQTSSLLYSHQLWQASGYCLHQCTLSRDIFFPELSVPVAVFKQLPSDGLEASQQKRAKLCNGQYRPKAAAAGLMADHLQTSSVPSKQPHKHVAHSPAAAAAAAAQQQWVSTAVIASPSSSSSHDGGQPVRQLAGNSVQAGCLQTAQLRMLPVPWPLEVAVKGQRSSRQRRSNIAQWRNAVFPVAAALQPLPGALEAVSAAADEQQQQQLDEQNGQQQGMLQQTVQQQIGVEHHNEQQQLAPSADDVVMQEQQLQSEAAALLQLSPASAPVAVQPSKHVAVADPTAADMVSSKLLPGKANTAGADAGPVETSTSSEQTHDGMNDSPRDQTRVPLSSWPSSSTDSICQLQQQQQQLSLALQQQCGPGSSGVMKHVPTSAAAGWASPSSPLPASAL